MKKGRSLHIGLNSVDPAAYDGWSGDLVACEADARDMEALAKSRGFAATRLLTAKATRKAVLAAIAAAAKALQPKDTFFLTYSGHGGQLPDTDGEEDDGMDETWCLFDGELLDDELYRALAAFRAGVRVLVLSDSCHSGSVVKAAFYRGAPAAFRGDGDVAVAAPPAFRAMPPAVALRTYEAHRAFYDKLQADPALSKAKAAVKASVLLISGCQDNQLSMDGTFNGLFTGTLKRVWNGGAFKKDYRRFHTAILAQMPPSQSPNFFTIGTPSAAFLAERPFTI